MTTYLITGGSGFIGSNLADALVGRGETVRIIDDFSTGRRKNIAHILDRITLFEGSILDHNLVKKAVEGVDYVLHQAAIPSVPRSVEDPFSSNEANITGTLNVLLASRDAKVKRLVFAASSSAYGETEVLPKVETMPATPVSPYAITKYCGELYCQNFHKNYGLETICLRYFNIFGPRQDPKSQYSAVIPAFITRMLLGEPPTIYGDGTQSRDFTHVENAIDANLKACTAPREAVGKVYNIACGERIDLNELVHVINDLLGTRIVPVHAPPRPGDVKHSMADIEAARRFIGFHPTVLFREGLERTIEWYRESWS